MVRRIKQPPRRAFVLGAGGVLGFAWTVGALTALKDELGVEVGEGDLLIGTSAGSVMAAILACGGDVDLIRRQQMGMPLPDDPPIHWRDEDSGGNTPPRPGLRPGSPRLLLGGIRHRSVPPIVALSGLLPRGRGSIDAVRGVIRTIAEERLDDPAEWPVRQAWLVAVDYKTGRRVVFGRQGSPAAALPDAVGASCAIPAWYQPVHINGVAYVDGGMYSNTSTDLTIGQGFDEVYVLAPMGAVRFDTPRSPVAMIERRVRKAITRGIQADLVKLRAEGVRTTFLAPGPADLDVMGMNLMNARRRIAVLHTSIHTTTNYLRGGGGTSGTQLRAVSG
jgi:NTE family protein